MKKLFIVLLSVMMLTLTSCGSNPNDALVEKYRPMIDALEAGDIEAAYLELVKYADAAKAEERKDMTTVELNVDNFNEYFEIVQATEIRYNAFNEVDYLSTGIGLKVNDSYVDRIIFDDPITCDVNYTYTSKICDVDLKTGEISNVRDTEWDYTVSESDVFNFYNDVYDGGPKMLPENTVSVGSSWSVSSVKDNYYGGLIEDADYNQFYEFTDISLNRVVGTILVK